MAKTIEECYQDLANAIVARAVQDIVDRDIMLYFFPSEDRRTPNPHWFDGIEEEAMEAAMEKTYPFEQKHEVFFSAQEYANHLAFGRIKAKMGAWNSTVYDAEAAEAFLEDGKRLSIYTTADPSMLKRAIKQKFRNDLEEVFVKLFTGKRLRGGRRRGQVYEYYNKSSDSNANRLFHGDGNSNDRKNNK